MGRPKGAINRRTRLQNAVSSLGCFSERVSKIIAQWLDDPDITQQREAVKLLTPYMWPKLQATTLSGDKDKDPLTIIVKRCQD